MGLRPEEQPSSEYFKERVIKIEARRSQEILDDMYGLGYDDDDDESADQGAADHPEQYVDIWDSSVPEKIEMPAYAPFDAAAALESLRDFSPEEKGFSVEERRKLVRERSEKLKEDLQKQKLGIGIVVKNLYEAIHNTPDIERDALFDILRPGALEYKLTEGQVNVFKWAFDGYASKHKAVEKYRALYPEDDQLFEACFGKMPEGKVVVVTGAMTLHFQCFEKADYAWAYTSNKLKEDQRKLTKEEEDKADLSGGAALWTNEIDELAGAVTIENLHRNLKYEVVTEHKTAELHNEALKLRVDEQRSDIDIEVKGLGKWQMKFLDRDTWGFPARFRLVSLNQSEPAVLFDVVRAIDEYYQGFLVHENDPEKRKYVNTIGYFRAEKEGTILWPGTVNADRDEITINDQSPEGTTITFTELNALPPTPDEQRSRTVQVHEEQHQFNKLFIPLEAELGDQEIMANAVEPNATGKEKSVEEIVDQFVRDLVRNERRYLFDGRARDEIVAYYRDGTPLDDILTTLRESKLYDYYEINRKSITAIPEKLRDRISENMSIVEYSVGRDEEGDFQYLNDAAPFTVGEEAIQKRVEIVFKDQYKRDLGLWIGSVKALEVKGYHRDEIVSLLAQEPVRNWSALARRLSDRAKEAEVST